MSTIVGASQETITAHSRMPPQPLLPKNNNKCGRPRSKSALAVVSTKKKSVTRSRNNEDMENAMKDVVDGNMTVLWVAKKRAVPKSTLHDQISGK